MQQRRGNSFLAPYSALSKGPEIPNLEVEAQVATQRTLTSSVFSENLDPDPDFPLTKFRGRVLYFNQKFLSTIFLHLIFLTIQTSFLS